MSKVLDTSKVLALPDDTDDIGWCKLAVPDAEVHRYGNGEFCIASTVHAGSMTPPFFFEHNAWSNLRFKHPYVVAYEDLRRSPNFAPLAALIRAEVWEIAKQDGLRLALDAVRGERLEGPEEYLRLEPSEDAKKGYDAAYSRAIQDAEQAIVTVQQKVAMMEGTYIAVDSPNATDKSNIGPIVVAVSPDRELVLQLVDRYVADDGGKVEWRGWIHGEEPDACQYDRKDGTRTLWLFHRNFDTATHHVWWDEGGEPEVVPC